MQVAVPFVPLHAVAQAPQFATFVLVFISQPLDRLPSQFPYPPLHTTPHCPPLQVAVPFVSLHAVAHVPQLPALVFVLVSQAFAALLSQSPNPAAHAPQAPMTQVVPPPHAVPACQAPFASHVCGTSPTHCFAPGTHAPPQTPAAHTYGQFGAFSHTPALVHVCGAVSLHCFVPGVQAPAQVPAVHT